MPEREDIIKGRQGIPEEMIPALANQAINDPCTPGNPRNVTVDDLISIYKQAY